MQKTTIKKLLVFFIFLSLFGINIFFVDASVVDELKNRISDKNTKIQELEKEIEQYQKDLDVVGEEKQTLESEVKRLDISRQKISTDIKLTQNKIDSTNFQIQKLSLDIDDKEIKIDKNISVIAETIRIMNEVESESLIEIMLSNNNLSEFFDQIESVQRFQTKIRDDVKQLTKLKEDFENKMNETERKKRELADLKNDLSDQKYILDINRKDKNNILKITENKESNYQKLLEEKHLQKEEFEEDLREIESQLQYELDPNKIPGAKSGVLLWPLADARNESCYTKKNPVKNCITQYFGNTEFAKTAAYIGEGHNGVDFRASSGTKVRTALSGTILKINQTATPGCQYGKWIFVKHNNGLSTLYAHLSFIPDKINVGQSVITGDTIGYSGSTGYSLGPHLHFTVYVSEAVSFREYTCKSGATSTIPTASFNAYLNPLDYL